MTHFPLFLNLKDRSVIIFGGGDFALQRIKKLSPFLPKITVISAVIKDEIKSLKGITCLERKFCAEDLDNQPALVVIAENEELTAELYAECKKRNLPVNAVDMPSYCDVIFPSIVATQNLCIGISSGGISPTATVEFKERIEDIIPKNIDEILSWMPMAKARIKASATSDSHNALLRAAFREAVIKNAPLTGQELGRIIDENNGK